MRDHVLKFNLAALPLTQDSGKLVGELFLHATEEGMALHLTKRDELILIALTKRVRCVSERLTALYFWCDPSCTQGACRRRLRLLENAGWLQSHEVYAKLLPVLTKPVVTWSPFDPIPDFGQLSYYLKTRFREPASSTRIFIATKKAAMRFGGFGDRMPRRSETTHDLGLTQVYFHILKTAPARAANWISEAALVATGTEQGEKLPDAMISPPDGRASVIEFGGEYGKEKLRAFHDYCANASLEYEIW